MSPRYLDVPGAAEYLTLSEHAVRHMVQRREIPFSKIGARIRFKIDDLDLWMRRHRVEAEAS